MWHIWGRSRTCGTYGGGVGHVSHMGEEWGMWDMGEGTLAYRVLVGKCEGRGPLGRPRHIFGG